MTKHTPAPWGIIKGDLGYVVFSGETGAMVARVICPMDDNGQANARLIAAAPDLLSELKGLQEIVKAAINSRDWVVDGSCDPDAQMIRAEKAIAKATGEQK